jgi:predicted nuclease of restriction endonuclease-like (RecB) superfamily
MSEIIKHKSGFEFFENVAQLIEQGRQFIGRTADLTMCATYFEIGRMIIEEEQDGKARAEYGAKLLPELAGFLTERFERGFSESTLKNARKFYQVYQPSIRQAMLAESYPFTLSWSHYLVLMRIKNDDERRFYEIEATKQQWPYRALQRQYGSSLYERLALSRDKEGVMRLAKEGQTIEKPNDLLKNPFVLEFSGLEENSSYSETKLEQALLNKLEKFLLELGKGFLYEARQKRFTFDEDHFRLDLIFYNRLLACYVLFDLKIGKLKHQDLGQMQMYVNYFDRHIKTERENPTIGILLCKEQSDSVVELTLPKDANIYAAEYSLYLPDKALLQRKLAEWVEEFEEVNGEAADET